MFSCVTKPACYLLASTGLLSIGADLTSWALKDQFNPRMKPEIAAYCEVKAKAGYSLAYTNSKLLRLPDSSVLLTHVPNIKAVFDRCTETAMERDSKDMSRADWRYWFEYPGDTKLEMPFGAELKDEDTGLPTPIILGNRTKAYEAKVDLGEIQDYLVDRQAILKADTVSQANTGQQAKKWIIENGPKSLSQDGYLRRGLDLVL